MNDYETEYTLQDFLDYDPLDSLTEEFGIREELDPETKRMLEQFASIKEIAKTAIPANLQQSNSTLSKSYTLREWLTICQLKT